MSREIKFRAFDDGEIINQTGALTDISRFFRVIRKDAIIMQFTGLHDRNGKEIYEGDIVRRVNEKYVGTNLDESINLMIKEKEIDKVVFKGSSFVAFNNILHRCGNIEIIGNIHENPELL